MHELTGTKHLSLRCPHLSLTHGSLHCSSGETVTSVTSMSPLQPKKVKKKKEKVEQPPAIPAKGMKTERQGYFKPQVQPWRESSAWDVRPWHSAPIPLVGNASVGENMPSACCWDQACIPTALGMAGSSPRLNQRPQLPVTERRAGPLPQRSHSY